MLPDRPAQWRSLYCCPRELYSANSAPFPEKGGWIRFKCPDPQDFTAFSNRFNVKAGFLRWCQLGKFLARKLKQDNIGRDLAECGWDLADCGRDLADCGWDLADCGLDQAEWAWESYLSLPKVAAVLVSITASSDIVESEGRQMTQCWIKYLKYQQQKAY